MKDSLLYMKSNVLAVSTANHYNCNIVYNDRYMFIFTYFMSKKSLFMRLGQDNLVRDNVLIDTSDLFYVPHNHDNIL